MKKVWDNLIWIINKTFFKHKKNRIERYIIPLIFIILILITKSFLHLFISNATSFNLLLLPVILSAWYGGLGPGLFATVVIGVLNDYFFLSPQFSLYSYDSGVITCIFILEGVLVSIISEALMQANKKKDEFIGFASHELKNPLATIQAFAQIIQKKAEKKRDSQFAHSASRIYEQAVKATSLIDDLLDLTRIESGKLTYHDEKFAIYELVQEIVENQRAISPTHKILFIGASKKVLYGDKYRIGQVIINLFSNAIKYSPGKKKVIITLKNKKDSVVISIRDYGIGIDKNSQNKIFNLFYRTQNTKNGKVQGLGLGLYISSEIVRKYNGRLWVESIKGKGTTFYVQLPTFLSKT